MNNDMRMSLIMDLKGNLEARARRNEQAIKKMSWRGSADLNRMNQGFSKQGSLIASVGRRLAALGLATAAFSAAGKVIDRDARFAQLQTDGRVAAEQIDKLKASIDALASDPSIRLAPDTILAGFEQIITSTGDFDFAMQALRTLALTIRATGAAGEDVGAVFSLAYKGGVRDAKELLRVNGAMLEQTLQGSLAYRDLAKIGKKLVAPAISKRGAGFQTFIEAGAVAQIVIDAVGSADEATEATKAFLSALVKTDVQKTLKDNAGIDVLGKSGKLRSLPVLIEEIFKASGGDYGLLGETFGESAIRVFEGFSLPGNAEQLRKLAAIQSDGSIIEKNARINALTAKGATQRLSNRAGVAADTLFSGPTKETAAIIDALETSNSPVSDTAKLQGMSLLKSASMLYTVRQTVIDSIRDVFRDDFKASVEIKVDGPATVGGITSGSRNFNVDVEENNGAVMVGN